MQKIVYDTLDLKLKVPKRVGDEQAKKIVMAKLKKNFSWPEKDIVIRIVKIEIAKKHSCIFASADFTMLV
jgi:hypothetical protein